MATILMPLPRRDFDPSETGIPWRMLSARGHRFVADDICESGQRLL